MKKTSLSLVLMFVSVIVISLSGCVSGKCCRSSDAMKELLKTNSLIVSYDDGEVKAYDENGIKPLFKHLENGDFKGAYVFDKVTGKASALLLAYGKAGKLHTGILSKEAIPVLKRHNIKYSADKTVEYIINKSGDDKCPMEKSVADIDDPEEAYKTLKEKFGN